MTGIKMNFATTENEMTTNRFAPCAADGLLLKTLPATVKRVVAQKVLLFSQGLDRGPVLSNLHHSGFKHNVMNANTLKRHGVSRGKTSGRENQPLNLTMKGRNLRQIHE